jgi:hypothetical protein
MKLVFKKRMHNQRKHKNKQQRKLQEKDCKQIEDVANTHLFGEIGMWMIQKMWKTWQPV